LRHFAAKRFHDRLAALPAHVQAQARENFRLLKSDPAHPSLQFKPVAAGRFRSVRIGLHYRASGVPMDEGVQWFWIGSHSDYDKLLG